MKTNERKELLNRRRNAHHAALASLIPGKVTKPGQACVGALLYRELVRIERVAARVILDYCNGDRGIGQAQLDAACDAARQRAAVVFGGKLPAGFIINRDPRGHVLKIDPDAGGIVPEGMERDWGGNGILAAEIN